MHGSGTHIYRPSQVTSVVNDVDETDDYNWTALHSASYKGHTDIVKELIKMNAIVDAVTSHGQTALHLAVVCGNLKTVEVLCEAGADVDAVTNFEKNAPLHLACEGGQRGIVAFLIAAGANVNAENAVYRSPLHFAGKIGRCDIGALLIGAKANYTKVDAAGWTCRQVAEFEGHKEFQEFIVRQGMTVSQSTIKVLPKAPWSGTLWTDVVDSYNVNKADIKKAIRAKEEHETAVREELKQKKLRALRRW